MHSRDEYIASIRGNKTINREEKSYIKKMMSGHDGKKNEEIQNENRDMTQAKSQDLSYSGKYTVISNALNVRYKPGDMSKNNVAYVIYRGASVVNDGYFTKIDGKIWLLIQCGDKTGYVMKDFVKKIN